jgi:hypothetical protein
MISNAKSVDEYLASLPDDRRAAINAVRDVIRKNLDSGYEEGMLYGGIGYFVPHRLFPAGYHCDPSKPLCFAGLGSQKHYISLGLMCIYNDKGEADRFRQEWKKTGKKLDMGVSCIRFKRVEDVPLDVIGRAVKRVPVKKFIAYYQSFLDSRAAAKTKKSPSKSKASGHKIKVK